jgi:hypothetical protein
MCKRGDDNVNAVTANVWNLLCFFCAIAIDAGHEGAIVK